MENLVLFGGTFDPIHNGHLRVAHAASLFLNADVIFIPNRATPIKTPFASMEDRLAMLNIALKAEGCASFSVSTIEIERKTKLSYWIDTLQYFVSRFPDRKIYFLIGADEVNSFPKWKESDKICQLATPLYVTRPKIHLNDEVLKRYRMMRLDYDGSGYVSSSAIRSLQSADLPLGVRDYIEEKQLYYFQTLSGLISKHRLIHSISVARLAYEIAARNKLPDAQKAYIAGILHDCGKRAPKDEALKIMKEQFASYYEEMPDWAYHQFIGSVYASSKFGVVDPTILDAIRFHATGKAHMSPIGKIIYAADKTDPLRGYDSKKLIRECKRNYYLGFVSVLKANRDYLVGKGYVVDNPLTKECMDLYLGEKRWKKIKK